MSKRYYKPLDQVSPVFDASGTLPIHDPVAVYYRQSTEAQIGNVSTSIQTIDMVSYLKKCGWNETEIYMIDMDAGISGTKKIDERPGMKRLFDLITESKIRAVACQDEDRLFRDITQIQVNIFIEACRTTNVLVITPSMVYDFANPLTGAFHARQFRFKCEMAAEYINSVVLGKLARAKQRMRAEGKWVGTQVTVGYMVDKRKTLPDGTENPGWRKYVPFAPYVELINEYFRLFLSYNGNLQKTARHIHEAGPFYPNPTTTQPPDGFYVNYRMNIYGNGYCPSLSGLQDLLMNATYIGHWTVKRVIRLFNNHEPIVPIDIFMQAFNYLSEVALDGHPNPNYCPRRQNIRPSCDEKRPVERPLYVGFMVSLKNDIWHNVGTEWMKRDSSYRYVFRSTTQMKPVFWTKIAKQVDDAITQLLHQKLTATLNTHTWEEVITQSTKIYEHERTQLDKQIATLEKVMESQIISLDTITNVDMIHAAQDRYEKAQAEHMRLTHARRAIENEESQVAALAGLRRDFSRVLEKWDTYTREQKRSVVEMLITRIEALPAEDKELRVTIYWLDGSLDNIIVEHKSSKGRAWTSKESRTLLALFDAGATQIEIAKAFPNRPWGYIYNRLRVFRNEDAHRFSPLPIRFKESYTMYLARIEHDLSPHRATGGTMWIQKDETLLLELLNKKVSRIELATAFPARTWRSIREKVRELRGKKVEIEGRGTLRQHETIEMYRLRTGHTLDPAMQSTGDYDEATSHTLSL